MQSTWRKDAVEQHNWKRLGIAIGVPFKDRRDETLPTASDMNALYYDCDLEHEAYEIAKKCQNGGPDFDYVGSNNETLRDGGYKPDFGFVITTVENWWGSAFNDGDLVDLKPSEENRPMIPFLQMANGGTNRIGCAYHECYDEAYQPVGEYEYSKDYHYGSAHQYGQKSYFLFVCKYGDPHIKVGTPIYTEGPPCDSCKDRCINGGLCDTKID